MQNWASLQETKQHGAVRFPFNLYPCTIPGDFPQVALHWQESMELVFVKRGAGLVQVGAVSYLARMYSHQGCRHFTDASFPLTHRFYARHPPRPAAGRRAVHGIRESHL